MKDKKKMERQRKTFKVAHIVPIRNLRTIESRVYHMCLAQMLVFPEYKAFYIDMVKKVAM